MSNPQSVFTINGREIIFYSIYDETCINCGGLTHIGVDTTGGEYGIDWICLSCFLLALSSVCN